MIKRVMSALLLAVVLAGPAVAQVTVRGQILMPGGEMPQEPVRFSLYSGDGRMNDIRFTDSNGRFVLERLSANFDYTIEVSGDDLTYGSTSYNFNPGYSSSVRVTLNPPRKRVTKPGIVSAASGYKPNAEAVDLHQAALKEIEKEDLDAAEAKLRKAVAKDPKFALPHVDLGVILIQGRKYAEAEEVLRQALVADPKSFIAQLNLGVALNRQHKYADAVPHLREAMRLRPGLVAGRLHLGVALVETGGHVEAERELLLAVKTPGEEEVAGLLYLGKLYAMTGAFPKGVDALEKYLQKAPAAGNAGEVRTLINRMKSEMAKPIR